MKLRIRWRDRHREREHRILRRVQGVLFALGALMLGFCALVYVDALVSRVYDERQFERRLATPAAAKVRR